MCWEISSLFFGPHLRSAMRPSLPKEGKIDRQDVQKKSEQKADEDERKIYE